MRKMMASIGLCNRRSNVITLILACIFSLFLVVGYIVSHSFQVRFHSIAIAIGFLACTLFIFIALSLLWKILDKVENAKSEHRVFFVFVDKHSRSLPFFFITQTLILLFWLPVWLAAFPGFYCYDTDAINAFSTGVYDQSHPLMWVIIVSGAINGFADLLGSFNAGVAVYAALIAFAVSSVLAYSVRYIAINHSPVIAIAGLFFYALDPIVSMFGICTAKDTLTSALLVLLFVMIMSLVKNPDILKRPKICIVLSLLVFFYCAFRNNSVLALLIVLPAILLLCSTNRLRLFLCFLSGILAFLVWSGPVASIALSGYERSPVDHSFMLLNSVPTQQLAFAWNDPDLTEEDRTLFMTVISESDIPILESVKPDDSDVARGAFANILIHDKNPSAFYELYFQEGLRHPDAYLRAFLSLTYEAWYPFSTPQGYNGGWNPAYSYDVSETSLFACFIESPAQHTSLFPQLYDFLWEISRYNVLQTNPFTGWLVSIPFFLWLLLATTARTLIKRADYTLAPCLLALSYVITLLLGPMVLPRYYLGLFYIAPLLLLCLRCSTKEALV